MVGAVVLLVALARTGWRLGHDLSSRFATPVCPFVPGRPTCAAYGFTNGTAYYLAWWCGAAGAAALAGLALVGLGRAGRRSEPRTRSRFETVVVGLALLRLGRAIWPVRDTAAG